MNKRLKRLINKINQLFSTEVSGFDEFGEELPEAGQGTLMRLGQKKPFIQLPKNFKEIKAPRKYANILESSNFYAGTFERNGKRIGYLRIPSYSVENLMNTPYSIRFYMAKLQEQSDELIIDQWNNPGGYVVFSDWIINSLVGGLRPDDHLKFAVRPREGFIQSYASLIKELTQMMKEGQISAAKEAQFDQYIKELELDFARLYRAYLKGDFISEPISLARKSKISLELLDMQRDKATQNVIDQISQQAGVDLSKDQFYDKKVYFLINEYDFSGGDATPATLKDYGRVTLVGRNTAGAGGTVESFKSEVFTPFSYSLTTSLMVRRTGELVENYGVTPDIAFDFTKQDYLSSFKNTFERLLEKLEL